MNSTNPSHDARADRKPGDSPMPSTEISDLCYLTASEALEHFRARSLSPLELLCAHIQRIEQLDPHLNSIRSRRFEQAHFQARKAEERYLRTPEIAGPLEGVPTLLKNEHEMIGEESDQGSLLFLGEIDTENAPITQRLLDAGAVIHARTHVPEFYAAAFTRSVAHGVTRNPWNPTITCGGSSGGSGAALAAGMACLSTASDIGGSIRVPAAYCGVVGFMPSYGRVPEAHFPFAMNTFNHNGLMCRSVADAVLMFNVINGPHPKDPSTVRPKLYLPQPSKDVRGLRIALSVDLGYFDVAPDIQKNTRQVAQMLRERGAEVEEVALPWDERVPRAFTDSLVFLLGRNLAPLVLNAPPGKVSDYVLRIARMGLNISPEAHLAATELMGELHQTLRQIFEHYDVLLCPTLARNQTLAEGVANAHDDLLRNAMTYPFNMFGRHPILAVPSGISEHKVPTGVQIVGRTFSEESVLRVGAALEDAVGWLRWRPALASCEPQ